MKFINYLSLLTLLLLGACGKKTITGKPERRNVTETVFASGALEPEGRYNLTAQTDGYIAQLKFEEGDSVGKDQVLALIDNRTNEINSAGAASLLSLAAMNASPDGPSQKQARQSVDLLGSKMAQDSIQYLRYQKLYETKSVSKLELENVRLVFESSKINYLNAWQNYQLIKQQTSQQLIQQKTQSGVSGVMSDYNQLKAVIGGRVYKRLKQTGDFVRRGEVIAVIGSKDLLFAKLSIDEANINKVRSGQEVVIQLNTDKEKNYRGKVTTLYPAFDELTQSFYCKVAFSDKLDFSVSGTQLQGNIIIAEKKNALVIPRNFLGFGNKVTVKGKGAADVKTGFISNEWVEITEGLEEGDEIVTDNIK